MRYINFHYKLRIGELIRNKLSGRAKRSNSFGGTRITNLLNFFLNLKTGHKIVGLILLMVFFLGTVGTVGYYFTGTMSRDIEEVSANNLMSVKLLNEARADAGSIEAGICRIVNPLTIDKFLEEQLIAEIKKRGERISVLITEYKKLNLGQLEQERVPALERETEAFRQDCQKIVDLTLTGRKAEAYAYFTQDTKPHIDAINALLSELADHNARTAEETRARNLGRAFIAKTVVVVTSVVAIIVAFSAGSWLSRFIARRLSVVDQALAEISTGNLQLAELSIGAQDEIGTIAQGLNKMAANLRSIVQRVATSAEHVAASSEELMAHTEQSTQAINQVMLAITEVAGGAHRQLSVVEETSSTITQIKGKLQNVADSAGTLAAMAEQSAGAAQTGSKAIEQAIVQIKDAQETVFDTADAVGKLGERSRDIGAIVETISQIAGQTNLLALNAAIEAARAGEHGRGFAVVAEEVRKLAEQSGRAAKKIASLIAEIRVDTENAVAAMHAGSRKVENGADAVTAAGNLFHDIEASVNLVSSQVSVISADIQNVAADSQEIDQAIASIELVSQEVAGQSDTVSATTRQQLVAMEEIALYGLKLAEMAEQLQSAIKQFRV